MDINHRSVFAVVMGAAWIMLSEYIRNELFFKFVWERHYQRMGIGYSSNQLNGMMWAVWSFLFASIIYILLQKFTLRQTVYMAWVIGFGLMWIVIGNLGVLPIELLPIAIPLSIAEVYYAAKIMKKVQHANHETS